MNAMELLSTRRSVGKLTDPAPDPATLARLVEVALRAPDHGALRPWRVIAIRGEARVAFGELLADVARAADPNADASKLDAARKKALRAPLLLVVACTARAHPKVPEIEQVLSAGCVAHGLLLALQAEGFGAIWRTGEAAYDPRVKQALGLAPSDHVVGFLYVGTPDAEPPAMTRPTATDHLSEWTPRSA
ncbi:MAG: nitroreductase family protein [Sandaracinaceae bacterium]